MLLFKENVRIKVLKDKLVILTTFASNLVKVRDLCSSSAIAIWIGLYVDISI